MDDLDIPALPWPIEAESERHPGPIQATAGASGGHLFTIPVNYHSRGDAVFARLDLYSTETASPSVLKARHHSRRRHSPRLQLLATPSRTLSPTPVTTPVLTAARNLVLVAESRSTSSYLPSSSPGANLGVASSATQVKYTNCSMGGFYVFGGQQSVGCLTFVHTAAVSSASSAYWLATACQGVSSFEDGPF